MEGKKSDLKDRYLTFCLKEEVYAIPLLEVKEVIEVSTATPIPNAPSYLKGIINLRGQVISIIDFRTKLKMPPGEVTPKSAIIILDLNGEQTFGVIVDRLQSVITIEDNKIQEAPYKNDDYIVGVYNHQDSLTLILDINQILNLTKKEQHLKVA